ncbi:MAG: hypothetical protein AABW90_02635 [Nanoarchaeota archaeon]
MKQKKANSRLCSVIKITRLPESKRSNSPFESDVIIKLLPNSKHSQQEIAGFVLIVLIVSVIGVVFLSIAFGKPETSKQTSVEVSNLLIASMYYTTDCAVNYIPQYRDVQDLIKECYNDKIGNYRECLGGEKVCKALEKNLKNILDKSLMVGEGSANKAYKLDIYFTVDSSDQSASSTREDILSLENGKFKNCTAVVGGSNPVPVGSFGFGKIETELLVCKS